MELSKKLVRDFVDATNDSSNQNSTKATTLYGTLKVDGENKRVILDGSDVFSPAILFVDGDNNDRVACVINNHTLMVTGNLTSPAATGAQLNNSIMRANQIIVNELSASYIHVNDIDANDGRFHYLKAEQLDATYLNADNIESKMAEIGYVKTDEIDAKIGTFGYLKAEDADLTYAKIDFANVTGQVVGTEIIKDSAITDAKIASLSANKLTAGTIDASKITVTNLNADNLTVGTINGQLIGQGSVALDKLAEEVATSEQVTTYITKNDKELSSIKQRTETVENSLDGKVDKQEFSEVIQTVESNSSSIIQLTDEMGRKADSSVVTNLSNRTSVIEQDVGNFKVSVAETYTTKTEFNNLSFDGLNLIKNSKTISGALVIVYLTDEDENILTNESGELLYI